MWEEFQTSASFLSQLRDPANAAAWTRFEKTYQPGILANCRQLGFGLQDAEDLSQEVLLKIVKEMPDFQYDPSKRFRGWLHTVVYNTALDFLKKNRNRPEKPAGGTDAHLVQEQVPDPYAEDPSALSERLAGMVSHNEAMRRLLMVEEALKRAKVRVRKPNRWASFEGVYLKGQSTVEVARELNESVAYVATAAAEVLDMVREAADTLRQEEGDPPTGSV
jgi:RNA polymerase sigma-70 factor (ECF subfamily)